MLFASFYALLDITIIGQRGLASSTIEFPMNREPAEGLNIE